MEWLRQLVGLPPTFTGVIQDTASTATLVALLCARERTTGYGRPAAGSRPSPRRSSSTPRRRPTARSRRRRCSPASGATTCACSRRRRARAAGRRARGGDRTRRRRRPAALRHRRHRGQHRHHRHRPGRAHRRDRAARTAPGSTSTPRWPARRWSCPSAAGCGRAWSGADSLVFNPHKWLGVGVRLLRLLRARPGAPRAGDGHQPELPADRRGRRR